MYWLLIIANVSAVVSVVLPTNSQLFYIPVLLAISLVIITFIILISGKYKNN